MKENELPSLLLLLREISGLDAEFAVYAMGDSPQLYEETLKQVCRLVPTHISQMEQYLEDNNGLNSFEVKIHSLKGSLRQIGCLSLPEIAGRLEKSAKRGERQQCIKLFNIFKTELIHLHRQVSEVLQNVADSEKASKTETKKSYSGNTNDFLKIILQIRAAAEEFDSILAAETLMPLVKYDFSGNINELLTKALDELSVFQPKKALIYIEKILEKSEKTEN